MKTLKYVALLVAAPCATALLNYLQNAEVWNLATLEHAAAAALLVGVGILVKSPVSK